MSRNEFPIVESTMWTVVSLLERAEHYAPSASNLQDELSELREHCARVLKAIEANAYDPIGMER